MHRSEDSAMSGHELWLAVTVPTVTNPRGPNEVNGGGLGRIDPGGRSFHRVDHDQRVMEDSSL